METNGLPKPLFEMDDDRLSFTSTIFIHPAFLESSETENETENDGLNDVEKAVLQYFKRHPQSTILKLCNDINLSRSHVTRAIRCKLPVGQTIQKMREGYSKVRNEALAMAFSYMHLIERWGTGMLRVAKMIKDAGLEKLEILGGETELRFNIYRNLDAGQTQEIAKQPGQTVGQTKEITKELGQTVGQNGEI